MVNNKSLFSSNDSIGQLHLRSSNTQTKVIYSENEIPLKSPRETIQQYLSIVPRSLKDGGRKVNWPMSQFGQCSIY